MANTVDKVLKVAEGEVGYLEKRSNSQLNSKTANAGSANWTKYGAYFSTNPAAWCDMFVDWCFVQAYGKAQAKAMIGGKFSGYTPTSAQYYKNMGRWYTKNPKVGDQIFFKNSVRICHTGIVYKVTSTTVYTIEGNTSGASGVIANGGGVCKKSYSLSYNRIAGYGRPKYDTVTTSTPSQTTQTTTTSGGNYMFSVPNLTKGSKGNAVKLLQKLLVAENYDLVIDGDFGNATKSAVQSYQSKKGIKVTYPGTVGSKTWSSLIGL